MLWRAGGEVPHIAAIMDLFTVALYGALGGHKDKRLMLALIGPPLLMLAALLGHTLWTTMPPPIAAFATLATLGSCATIVMNGFAMHRSDRELHRINAALDAERAALESRVSARTAELSAAMVLAQEANIAKSQFLAVMSHELRTPLNAMIGYAEILEEDLRETPARARPEDAARIARAARTQLGQVEDILDLSQIDAGRMETERAPVDVAALLESIVQAVSGLAAENGDTVCVDVAEGMAPVMTDARRLRQCVLNLAVNACKFTRGGDVRIVARMAGDAHGHWLEIDVADTGCGIAADELSRLFKPFAQVDASATRKVGGAGLGLVITRSLIGLLGGALAVKSTTGAGSTFTLRLPA
jgi:signal transduction histidine kinase